MSDARAGRGLLVTVEGIEGSGKSSLARWLVARLATEGLDVLHTREPGASPLGARLRAILLDPASRGMDPLAELLLYCADRAEHVNTVIAPALARGTLVLCDRFSDATRAYQGFGRGLGTALVDRVNVADRTPDLTLLLDLPAREGLVRARARNLAAGLAHESRFEDEEVEFHERVRAGYLEIARAAPERVRRIDAAPAEDVVQAAALAVVREALACR